MGSRCSVGVPSYEDGTSPGTRGEEVSFRVVEGALVPNRDVVHRRTGLPSCTVRSLSGPKSGLIRRTLDSWSSTTQRSWNERRKYFVYFTPRLLHCVRLSPGLGPPSRVGGRRDETPRKGATDPVPRRRHLRLGARVRGTLRHCVFSLGSPTTPRPLDSRGVGVRGFVPVDSGEASRPDPDPFCPGRVTRTSGGLLRFGGFYVSGAGCDL